nr:AF4/FMR2 family member lilli [Drosophila suzukii]
MSKLSETKIPITEFLEAYRRQPCLYNSQMDSYKNRTSREEAYEAIIRSLKIPQLTVVDIKLKIKSVRTVYSKELRIWMREKELGRSYEPKLFWFKLADSFLHSVSLSHCKRAKNQHANAAPQTAVKTKESLTPSSKLLFTAAADISMSEDALEEEDEETEGEAEEGPPDHSKPPASSCIISMAADQARCGKDELIIDDSSLCLVEQQQQLQQQQQQHLHHQQGHSQQLGSTQAQRKPKFSLGLDSAAEDELMIFGQSIASQLRTISDSYSRSVAKLRIQQVLFEAETGQFQSTEVNSTQLQHTF